MSVINVSPTCVASGAHAMGIRVLSDLMAPSFSFSALRDVWDFEKWTCVFIQKTSHVQRPLKPQHSLSNFTWLHVGSNKALGCCSKIPSERARNLLLPWTFSFWERNSGSDSHLSFPVQCSFFHFFAFTVSKSVFREQTWWLGPPYLLLHPWLSFASVMEINDVSRHRIWALRWEDGKFVPLLAQSLAWL